MMRNAEGDLPKFVGSLILPLPGILIRLGWHAFWFKHKAYKAARIYRRELTRHGLSNTVIRRLTDAYFEGSDPFKLLRILR